MDDGAGSWRFDMILRDYNFELELSNSFVLELVGNIVNVLEVVVALNDLNKTVVDIDDFDNSVCYNNYLIVDNNCCCYYYYYGEKI